MKKEINSAILQTKKLRLSKTTISNLKQSDMSKMIGGGHGTGQYCGGTGHTKNGNSCPGHNTCVSC